MVREVISLFWPHLLSRSLKVLVMSIFLRVVLLASLVPSSGVSLSCCVHNVLRVLDAVSGFVTHVGLLYDGVCVCVTVCVCQPSERKEEKE